MDWFLTQVQPHQPDMRLELDTGKFRIGKVIPWRPEGAMMRKGTQGGSSELLSPERQREMDTYFMAELKRLGSDFPYEEFCDLA